MVPGRGGLDRAFVTIDKDTWSAAQEREPVHVMEFSPGAVKTWAGLVPMGSRWFRSCGASKRPLTRPSGTLSPLRGARGETRRATGPGGTLRPVKTDLSAR